MRPVGAEPVEASPLDERSDEYTLKLAELDPTLAIEWGIGTARRGFADYSPQGYEEAAHLDKEMLQFVSSYECQTPGDKVTASALKDRLSLAIAMHESGEDLRCLNNLASPMQTIRDSFDLMPKATAADWSHICDQSASVARALDGYRASLAAAASQGNVAAIRQVNAAIAQSRNVASLKPGTTFQRLRDEAPPNTAGIEDTTREAADAYGRFADWLEKELLPVAPEEDGFGRDRYPLFSQLFVGAKIDLEETYQWGLDELKRIDAEQTQIARELYGPGTTPREAMRRLDKEERYLVRGTEELRKWMQSLADQAITELNGTEFEIPKPLLAIEAVVDRGDGGIYYTPPNSTFTRPGRMCWSVPPEEDTFHTWQERTTVFHEGVPGHHLQIGQALVSAQHLNLWRRFASWNSGHGEGWALYAEKLMAELGYQDDLGNRMGVLDAERLRSARVALDIGVHLGLPAPGSTKPWDADFAWAFLKDNVAMADGFLRFELDRYLGWPGQAPSYKVGARLWEKLRLDYEHKHADLLPEQARRRFHTQALSLGSLPMDTLREALLS